MDKRDLTFFGDSSIPCSFKLPDDFFFGGLEDKSPGTKFYISWLNSETSAVQACPRGYWAILIFCFGSPYPLTGLFDLSSLTTLRTGNKCLEDGCIGGLSGDLMLDDGEGFCCGELSSAPLFKLSSFLLD